MLSLNWPMSRLRWISHIREFWYTVKSRWQRQPQLSAVERYAEGGVRNWPSKLQAVLIVARTLRLQIGLEATQAPMDLAHCSRG